MQDRSPFDPEKITLFDIRVTSESIRTTERFDSVKELNYKVENSLRLGFNLEDKLARAMLEIEVEAVDPEGESGEVTAAFEMIFMYRIDNLQDLVTVGKKEKLTLDPGLGNALSTVTYSTARGLLFARTQGTALQQFILPVIKPANLIHHKRN